MSVFFVGAFNPITSEMSESSSGAGAKVQYEIIRAVSSKHSKFKSLVLQEVKTWPFNKFFIASKSFNGIYFTPMINLFFLKKIIFSLYIFFHLLIANPSKVYFYNTSSPMNLLMLILGLIRRKQVKVLIIQDLHAPKKIDLINIYRLDKVFEYFCFKITKYSFNYFVPITKQLGVYLNLPANRVHPFLGGVTDDFADIKCFDAKNFAVFAGALEKYNGVDFLLDAWSKLDTSVVLHIFGSGTLSDLSSSYSNQYKNIVYHGFQSPLIVRKYIKFASLNFCLRYSRGIEEEFFFPSKFFDVISSRGLVVCNSFKNLPEEFKASIYFINDDFSNLSSIINALDISPSFYEQRTKVLLEKFSWRNLITELDQVFGI